MKTLIAILATFLLSAWTGAPVHAKAPAKNAPAKRLKKEVGTEPTYSAIDNSNTELADDESDFASAKPEKHRAALAKEDPITAMAQALRQPSSTQHRNTNIGNSSDLQPFTDLEIPQ